MKLLDFFLRDTTAEDYLKIFRDWRSLELTQTDWTQLPDAPVDAQAWAIYRQKLRDLPADTKFPDVELPIRPS